MRATVLTVVLTLLVLLGPAAAKVQRAPEDVAPVLTEGEPVVLAPVNKLTFANACAIGQRITIVGVGDLLFHPELEREALTPTGTYREFWKPVQEVLSGSDITYGNFEGTSAEGITTQLEFVKDPGRNWNNRVYTAPPSQLLFNYHPSVIDDLIASHFGVVSTANTHSLDRGPVGIDRTVANLDKRGLAFTGTRPQDATDHPFSVVTHVKGFSIAWLACTYATNGFPDRHNQVLYCFEQRGQVLAEIKRLAAEPSIDAVILTPHWGLEGSPTPEQRQRDLASDAIEAGAVAVIGTHPHVLQPWEKMTSKDGREGLVIYSTGNFISAQRRPEQRLGAMVVIELTKEPNAAKARMTAAGYVSTWVEIDGPHRVTEAPRTMPSRFLPAGNRVFASDLPKLPRSCADNDMVAESWDQKPVVTSELLPLPGAKGPEIAAAVKPMKLNANAVPGLPARLSVPHVGAGLELAFGPAVIAHLAGAVEAVGHSVNAAEPPNRSELPAGERWAKLAADIGKAVASDDAARAAELAAAAKPAVMAVATATRVKLIRRRLTTVGATVGVLTGASHLYTSAR